jgi:uncharacterized membrane protein
VALASVSAALSLTVVAVVAGQDLLWAFLLMLVIVARHQPNLARWLEARRPAPLRDEPDVT